MYRFAHLLAQTKIYKNNGIDSRLVFRATTGGERRGVLRRVTLLTSSPASLVFKASVASPTAALVNPLDRKSVV